MVNSAASTTEKMSKRFRSRVDPKIFCIYFVVDFTSNFVQEYLEGQLLQRYRVLSVYIGPSYRWCCGNDEKKTMDVTTKLGLPAHKTRLWFFWFKMCCLQIFSIKQQVPMVTNDKIMMSLVLQILKNLVFKSSILIIPQIMLIFSLQDNTRGAPPIVMQ